MKKHFGGFCQKHWRYSFLCTDHSLNVSLLEFKDVILWGKGLWKFNNCLTSNVEYGEKMKNHIFETLRMLHQNNITEKNLDVRFYNL